MWTPSRREFLRAGVAATAGGGLAGAGLWHSRQALAQLPGQRPAPPDGVQVLNPAARVPVSLIIDDSTCLANLAHFAMPQFAQTWPHRDAYQKPWRQWPREIPDDFLRRFAQWCGERGVKGKFSVVPYPACVGWLDRFLPGWSADELRQSLELVHQQIVPQWDIHPEMVSHTRVIDTKTGRPFQDPGEYFMENWRWSDGKSVDELAHYMAYALKVLKNVDLPCQGITTPGGFGNRVLPELAQATLQACRDVHAVEVPHYFRHLYTDQRSVAPQVQYAAGLDGSDPRCVVSIIGCTGDWFGGWDGDTPGSADRFIAPDLASGRMVDVIARGEPAIMVCHWPGLYFNGQELGFHIFQQVVARLDARFDHLLWMKLSEIARYWAARELTRIQRHANTVVLEAPFAAERFTLAVDVPPGSTPAPPRLDDGKPLRKVARPIDLEPDTWTPKGQQMWVCFNLDRGRTQVRL